MVSGYARVVVTYLIPASVLMFIYFQFILDESHTSLPSSSLPSSRPVQEPFDTSKWDLDRFRVKREVPESYVAPELSPPVQLGGDPSMPAIPGVAGVLSFPGGPLMVTMAEVRLLKDLLMSTSMSPACHHIICIITISTKTLTTPTRWVSSLPTPRPPTPANLPRSPGRLATNNKMTSSTISIDTTAISNISSETTPKPPSRPSCAGQPGLTGKLLDLPRRLVMMMMFGFEVASSTRNST